MMKGLFTLATVSFWGALAAVWAVAQPSADSAPASVTPTYTLAEVARHGSESDCWMAIHGQVYDLSAYLPEHPTRPSIILPWCGKEATEAYDTKTRGRPHSPGADQLLEQYRIGVLKDPGSPQ